MSQKYRFNKSNSTVKSRSYIKGGEGTVFSQLKNMFKVSPLVKNSSNDIFFSQKWAPNKISSLLNNPVV